MLKKKLLCAVIVVTAICFVIFYYYLKEVQLISDSYDRIHNKELKMRIPEFYQEAANQLALYCQSVTEKYNDQNIGSILYPKVIRELSPLSGYISPDGAWIEIGCGFYHLAYRLKKDISVTNPEYNFWVLSIVTDTGSVEEDLCSVKLLKDKCIPTDNFIKNAIRDYDALINKNVDSTYIHKKKIFFLLIFQKYNLALKACNDAILDKPNYWWFHLTRTFLKSQLENQNGATIEFQDWVANNLTFANLFYLTLYSYLENQDVTFKQTVNRIIKDSLVVFDEDQRDTYLFGWNIVVMCYNLGEYQLAIDTYNRIDKLLSDSKKPNDENKRSKEFKKIFKNCIEGTNFIIMLKHNNYRTLYNPYLCQIDDSIKSIKVGNHLFPIDIEKKK